MANKDIPEYEAIKQIILRKEKLQAQLKKVYKQVAELERELAEIRQTETPSAIVSNKRRNEAIEDDILRNELISRNDYELYCAMATKKPKKNTLTLRSQSLEQLLASEKHLSLLVKENELEWASAISRLNFSVVETYLAPLRKGAGNKRVYKMYGRTIDSNLPFNALMEVHEADKTVLNLNIRVSYKMQCEMNQHLKLIEKECHLLKFFRLVTDYAKLNVQRSEIFYSLACKYEQFREPSKQKTVSNSSEDEIKKDDAKQAAEEIFLRFIGPESTSPELVFIWTMQVDDYAHVTPNVQLVVHLPSQVVDSEAEYRMNCIVKKFSRFVHSIGPHAAIEQMIRACYMSPLDDSINNIEDSL
ncbi:hypothetical protein BDF19DRAFT_429065 [Syncephalis fuscata]|nr:hypothetical protein BDF19DRAFT_429065 [Syncephalis fuscata]